MKNTNSIFYKRDHIISTNMVRHFLALDYMLKHYTEKLEPMEEKTYWCADNYGGNHPVSIKMVRAR